jgi:hypothetical protein
VTVTVTVMQNHWASFTADGLSLEMPQAGDELILVLESVAKDTGFNADSSLEKELDKWTYMLPNHDSAGVSSDSRAAKMVFPLKAPAVADASGEAVIWQLVPSFASMTNRACWERGGYWRLGMVY